MKVRHDCHPGPRHQAPLRWLPALCLGLLVLGSALTHTQSASAGIDALLDRFRAALDATGDFEQLFGATVTRDQREHYRAELLPPGVIRRVVRERERRPMRGVPEEDARRLVVEIFEESAGSARLLTAGLTIARGAGTGVDAWRIAGVEMLGTVHGLYRLRLDASTQYAATGLVISAGDLQLRMETGTVFLIRCDEGVTGAVLLGRGTMRFSPAPEAERGQVRLFAGSEVLDTPFQYAVLRLNPADYRRRIPQGSLMEVPVDDDLARRAEEIAQRELPASFTVDLHDVTDGRWHLLPTAGDLVAEIRTRRYGTLTFSRFASQPEDVSLTSRQRKLTIALYPSAEKLSTHGRFYSEAAQRDIDVLDYNVEAFVSPDEQFLRGRARLSLRTRTALSMLTLRLADSLAVSSITSAQAGPLTHLRLENQNALIVRLPRALPEGSPLTLTVSYAGSIVSQPLEDGVPAESDGRVPGNPEPYFLLSSASLWYPQNSFSDFATATLRLIAPDEYGCVASGDVPDGPVAPLTQLEVQRDSRECVFRADRPLRYFAALFGRFNRVAQQEMTLAPSGDPADGGDRVRLTVEAHPLQRSRARQLVEPAADAYRFYWSLLGDAPFPSATLALVESELPGGHSPGYFSLLNSPLFISAVTWQNDPAAFQGFPEFFLAHELAHQWWGQAIGGNNYHEAWLSEGFAQYFSALYAQRRRGDRVFRDMLRQFRRWALAESANGPVYLGRRLGRISGGPRVFRAIVYDKGAAVLHMLRRFIGDDAFFAGLRRFYREHRFQTAGTDDLQTAFEAEAERPLGRFFERWIYESAMPRVIDRSAIVAGRAVVRLEQVNERVFDLPVTVTLTHIDGTKTEVVVVMTEKHLDQTIATGTPVREIEINRDDAALAEFDGN